MERVSCGKINRSQDWWRDSCQPSFVLDKIMFLSHNEGVARYGKWQKKTQTTAQIVFFCAHEDCARMSDICWRSVMVAHIQDVFVLWRHPSWLQDRDNSPEGPESQENELQLLTPSYGHFRQDMSLIESRAPNLKEFIIIVPIIKKINTFSIFPTSWDDDPIWLSYFQGGRYTTNQHIDWGGIPDRHIHGIRMVSWGPLGGSLWGTWVAPARSGCPDNQFPDINVTVQGIAAWHCRSHRDRYGFLDKCHDVMPRKCQKMVTNYEKSQLPASSDHFIHNYPVIYHYIILYHAT